MQPSKHILHVSEADFQHEVLAHSNQQPVVVDFWAEWCAPCHLLDPILERLAEEASGAYRLAKVDVDASPKLAQEFGVQGVPTVKVFRNSQVVAEFSGLRPEPQIREFLKSIAPDTHDLAVGKANSLLGKNQWQDAEAAFRQVLDANPDQPGALLGLAKCLLARDKPADALPILRNFPVSREFSLAEHLIPLAEAMVTAEIQANGDELASLYQNALRLAGHGQIPAALDGMMELLRKDKNYLRGQSHKVVLGILALLGEENPLTREYRAELASLLF